MSSITTHVLDTAEGRPAAGVAVELELEEASGWRSLGRGVTDSDGRARDLIDAADEVASGRYRLTFATGAYFESAGRNSFYPQVVVEFCVRDTSQHHHVPLLLSPFGYSTYRGS